MVIEGCVYKMKKEVFLRGKERQYDCEVRG
eukprot:SAG25_NODE_7270_length_491_cov_1.397959_2_plen_29_part_01